MQAIETKYLPATGKTGSRIKATSGNGVYSATIPYPNDGSEEAMHWGAAYALACKLGWAGDYIAGGTKAGYVFVPLPSSTICATAYRVHPAATA